MRAILGIAALILTAAGAQAASLQGEAMVSRGEGYKAQVGGQLRSGDLVMVRRDSGATIAFEDGCNINLKSGQVLTIGAKSPCANGAQPRAIDFGGRMGNSHDDDPHGIAGLPSTTLIVGGVALAVGVGALIYYATKDDNKSSSP